MKQLMNNTSIQIISINDMPTALNAALSFNEKHETIIVIYNVPIDFISIKEKYLLDYIIAKGPENSFISVFDAQIKNQVFSMHNEGTCTITLRSTNVIVGNAPLTPGNTFQHFDLKITDGCELIGLCPYDVAENYSDFALNMKKIDIPINISQLSADTTLGAWSFYVIPDHRFDRESLTLGFDQRIHFESKLPLTFKEFHTVFNKLTGFFEILCGELVTINELTLHNGSYDENYCSYEFIGYSNYPLEKLRFLKGNGMDSTGYLRGSIFKASDFENLTQALDKWFDLIDKIPLANNAYQRILLDEDVEIITENKFLAAMQLVEGYASAFSDKQADYQEFENTKAEIIDKTDSEEDKEFLTNYCSYSGGAFRKMLKNFTFESISKIEPQSMTQFIKKSGGLINRIKNDRDIYTHSSSHATQLNTFELADIAIIYKHLYRINVLSQLGISSDLLCKRLSYRRGFAFDIQKYFSVTLESPNNVRTEFDSQMWLFSQT